MSTFAPITPASPSASHWGLPVSSRISAAREGFCLTGLILAVVLPSALQPLIGRQAALLALGGVLGIALMIALPIFCAWLASVRLQIAVPRNALRVFRVSTHVTA